MNSKINFKDSSDNEIDLGKITRYLLMQSKLILLIVSSVFILSFIIYITATKNYKIVSLLQVESSNQNLVNPVSSIDIAYSSNSSDITNLISLYESRTNIIKVIDELDLNIYVDNSNTKKNIDIDINNLSGNEDYYQNFYIETLENSYNLFDSSNRLIGEYSYDNYIKALDLNINVVQTNDLNKRFEITYQDPSTLYNLYKNQIRLSSNLSKNSWFSQEGLIEVSIVTDDIDLGKKIIDRANEIFIDYRISVETEKARKAIIYIDENIKSLKELVDFNKTKLKDFREKNKSLNVDLEIQSVIQKIQEIEAAINDLEVEISNASEIYTYNNPLFLNLIKKRDILNSQKNKILSEINELPKEQQEYIDLFKDVEISQKLFEELESRRLGFSILEASTIGNIRVIDSAYTKSLVSPKFINVLIASFFAFVIAIVIAIVRGINFLPITNPAELFDNGLDQPILGVLPFIKNIDIASDDEQFKTSLESLIVNIRSIQGNNSDKKIITITSPSPYNGKSTVSKFLAEHLVKLGKKVLLVDNDLKRGKLHRSYNLKTIRREDFIGIDDTNLSRYQISKNLYFIPRISRLTNTFQFICSEEYQSKVDYFRESFDYIIFDSAPILSVADTPILLTKTDISLVVVRHSINKINEIKQTQINFAQIDKEIDGFIYNAYAKPKSYYGYYSLYGSYSYQYYADKYLEEAYDYKKDE